MNILVTGGTGSIGAWVVHELLESGHTPIIFDINIREQFLDGITKNIHFVEGDITNYDSIFNCVSNYDVDRIIHLAKILPAHSEERPVHALNVNVSGTGNVLKAAVNSGIKRVVFSSSKSVFDTISEEYGPPLFKPLPIDYPKFSRTSLDHVPFYTITNKMVEYFAIRYSRANDLELVITRFGSTWGPGKLQTQYEVYDKNPQYTGGWLICRMIESAMSGSSTEVNASQLKTDNVVYTKDVALGVTLAALSDNIQFASGYREFLLDAGCVFNHKDFAEVLCELYPSFNLIINENDGSMASHRGGVACRFDLSRSEKELGYSPRFADVKTAVNDYITTSKKYIK
jgi:UDP-glucose 4-epimerase